MTHTCPNCRSLKTSGECETCGWDPLDEERSSDGFAFDGGRPQGPEDSLEGHLEAALEVAETPEARYHIRSALQHQALLEGRVSWKGTVTTNRFGPANGGVVD